MLGAIRHLWKRYLSSLPKSEVVDSIPESQWNRADLLPRVSKAQRKAFTDLLVLLYAHLPAEQAARRVQRGSASLARGDEVDAALSNALLPEDEGDGDGNQGFIACDWKAAEEVQWQADLLCQKHGLSEKWSSPGGTLTDALRDLDAWLQARGRRLLCASVGDSVLAFAVPDESAASAMALAKRLKLTLGAPGDV